MLYFLFFVCNGGLLLIIEKILITPVGYLYKFYCPCDIVSFTLVIVLNVMQNYSEDFYSGKFIPLKNCWTERPEQVDDMHDAVTFDFLP